MKTEGSAKVSVIMPAYNAEKFIETSIRSAMNQTYDNLEIIVVDDCSGDGTCAIAERLAMEDPRIRLIRNERNMGAAGSRNRGLDICTGDYAAFLDSDDLWYPEKLERQLELAWRTRADIVYCSYAMIDEEGNRKCADFLVSPKATLESTLAKCEISCSTAFFSRKVINAYRFSAEYYHEDYVLWLTLLKDGLQAVGVTEVLAAYRLRTNSRAANKFHTAMNRWKVYRVYMNFSFVQSAYWFAQYAVEGIKKYWTAR